MLKVAILDRQQIEDSIRRWQLNGLLTSHDLTELRYLTDLWSNLLNAVFGVYL